MSLTLPTAYSNTSKLGNIQENWIVQLGFFNGDADGSGEGGWDATLQDDGTTANLINFIGSELVQDGDNPDHRLSTWTMRDRDGNSDGWGTGAPSPYSDDEIAAMINTLTGGAIDAGLPYSLTFTVGVATLSLAIGGGDLTGNAADETFVAKANYAVGTHTVTFTATADRSHLWFTADTSSAGNGTIDDVTLKKNGYGAAETAIIVDDGTVFQNGDYIKIESEIIKIKSISTHTLTVARGAMGTTAAVHLNNTALYWNNFTPISLADTTVDDVFYHGTITNRPSIRSSINLTNSTAKTGNISLSIVNFQYKGDDFSAELFFGTRKYVNREVKIYSQLNGDTTLANCLLLFQGRLKGIKHSDSTIQLSIANYSPWDRVDYPNTYSDEKVVAPVSFGNFGGHDNYYTNATPNLWRPVPFTSIGANGGEYVIGTDSESSCNVTRYTSEVDHFSPLLLSAGASTTRTNVETVYVNTSSNYKYYHLPNSNTEASSDETITETNMDRAYNGNTANAGNVLFSQTGITGNINLTHHETYNISNTESDATITLKYKVPTFSTNNMTNESIKVSFNTAGGDSSVDTHTAVETSLQVITKDITSAITSIDLEIQFLGTLDAGVGPESMSLGVDIYELYASTIKAKEDSDEIFTDADGTIKNYAAGEEVANIHEAHRSLLHGHLNLTDTPTGWSDLDTERKTNQTWTVLYWQNDQEPIKTLLEKLQFEGCFIYMFERGVGKYIFIADSPSSTKTITKQDISDFTIDEINFTELETKHIIDYDPHPARNIYRSQVTVTSSSRSDYSFEDNENVINIQLNALAGSISGGSNRNDDWATYRTNLFGELKLTVQYNSINPANLDLEVGDIIDFDDMVVDPGGGSWSGRKFIIITTHRSVGVLKIKAREI